MSRRAGFVALAVSVACGGMSEGQGPRGDGGGPSTGGATSGGLAGVGGLTPRAGAGGGAPVNQCDEDGYETCLFDCKAEGDVEWGTVCEGGAWRCPDGMTPLSECPPGTCAIRYVSCCDPTNGVGFAPTCESGPYGGDCPVGSVIVRQFSPCLTGSGEACAATAAETGGRACPFEDAMCAYGTGCGATICECELGSDDELVWHCIANPC